jgi:hypothetical protein
MLSLGNAKAQDNVDTKILVNDVKDENTFVVIISNENYKYEESVPFAKNDGEVFRIYCQKTLGIPESNIRYAPDATLNEMNYQFSWLEDALKAYDGTARAIIYYTGHGMPDESSKEAYLLPVDGFSKSPATSALSTRALYDKLGKMNSKSIMVFLDACFSGAKRDGNMLASSRGVAIKPNSNPVGSNTVVFSAAQGHETAYPYKSMKHGMFTYYILDKLQQAGGAVTMGDLSDYVTTQVKRKSVVENGKSQTPTVVAINNDWKGWQLATKAAKKVETRNVLDTPKPAPTANAAPAPQQPGQVPVGTPISGQTADNPIVMTDMVNWRALMPAVKWIGWGTVLILFSVAIGDAENPFWPIGLALAVVGLCKGFILYKEQKALQEAWNRGQQMSPREPMREGIPVPPSFDQDYKEDDNTPYQPY